MRIAVISPHATKNGNTTLAMLIGLEYANSDKLVCITHAQPTSKSFFKYFSFSGFADKTSTPSQIVKILKEGGLRGDEVRDYCKPIQNNLEAFTNEYSNFTSEDMIFMQKYIARMFPHEHVIFDVDTDDIVEMKNIIKYCDIVVLNITQDYIDLDEFKQNRDKYLDAIGNKPVVTVVNKFNATRMNLKEVAHAMGVRKPSNWLILRDNPWIGWATNHGKMTQLFRQIMKKDPRVIEIYYDITKICQTIMKVKSANDKRGPRK
ncbi:MAG: hypothetical protein IJ593_10490 [Lachnospiraceae bacterium]|nr:hypothetical protein [Lachnospiraceae bacterium]